MSNVKCQMSQKGFTLIELLVSMAVIAAVSGLVFANVGARRTDLTRVAQKLALDIRQAQNLSLAPSDIPNCIYGFKAASNQSYFLYRNADCAVSGYTHSGSSVKVSPQDVVFQGGIIISNFSSTMDVAFEAPEPITYLNGATTTSSLTFTLQSPDGRQKNVTVNRFGGVEIQ